MLKIIGAILCITGCSGYGILQINRWKHAVRELEEWILLFRNIRSQIYYQRNPLEEIFCCLGEDIYGIAGKYIMEVGRMANENREMDFQEVWRRNLLCWKKESMLPSFIKDKLIHFIDYAKEQDPELQISHLDRYIHDLEYEKKRLELQIRERKKPVMTLSVSLGILISLLLF